MADIKPFRGVLYNSEICGDMAKVITPPYDVISPGMQHEFYDSHPYNVVRLILGKIESGDTTKNNRYTRARDCLNHWLDRKILARDTEPSFYIYQQSYQHKNELKVRIGFIGLMEIEDPRTSKVLPHEYTFKGPKIDRLKLMTETKANLSPIFSLFEDDNSYVTDILGKATKSTAPLLDINTDGVTHKLWKLDNAADIRNIQDFMKSKAIFIADGHHRYEVALAFRDRMKKIGKLKPEFNRIMVYFSNLNQDAITILSTYRVVKDINGMTTKTLVSKLAKFFEIKDFSDKEQLLKILEDGERIQFGLYCGGKKLYLLTLKDEEVLDRLVKPDEWKRLSVSVLHQLIFNHMLKIKEKVAKEDNIIYTRDHKEAIKLVDEKGYTAAFFLNPTKVDQFKGIARSRDRMPHKSTYFYPKLLSGLVINKF